MKQITAILAGVLGCAFALPAQADTTPDPFSLPSYTNAPYGSEINNSIFITGIDQPAAVTITGGQYALDCNQASGFTSAPGTVTNERSICVRHFSSMTPGALTQTTITVGGVSATLSSTVTTAPLNSVPFPFAFQAQRNLLPGGTYRACTSSFNPPLNSALTISTTGAVWIHPFNGLKQSAPGIIPPYNQTCMEYVAPATFDTPFTATMTVTGTNNGVPGTTSATLSARTIASGRLDPAFGINGVRTYDIGTHDSDVIWALLQQPDGKVIGTGSGGNGNRVDAILVRLKADGSPDTTFGIGGAVFPVDGIVDQFYDTSDSLSAALAPDGKIYWVVSARNEATPTQTYDVLYRLNADGTFDTTFGFNGQISSTNTPSQNVAIQPEGKVLVAGRSGNNGELLRLLRFNTTNASQGSVVDSTFGSGGQVSALVGPSPNNQFTGVGFTTEANGQPSKIIQVGGFPDPAKGICLSVQCESITVLRWTHTGVLDNTFGCAMPPTCSGRVEVSYTALNNLPRQIRVQPDNKILIVFRRQSGSANNSNGLDFAIARLNADGSKDLGFGTNGEAVLDVRGYGASRDSLNDLYLYPDGRILVLGRSSGSVNNLVSPPADDRGNSDDIVLARFLPNGQLDPTFGDQGSLMVPLGIRQELALALAVDSQGRATVGGELFDTETGETDVFFARFIIDPVADIVPDAFSFTAAPGVQPGTTVTSASITVNGIDAPAPISVSNASTYSIGCTGTFTATSATVTNGQTVCVRHVAPLAFNTPTTTTLTIGGVAGSFTSTTAAALPPGLDFDNDGIPNEVESPEGKNPFVKDNDVFFSDRLFTMQQYRDFLGREGDAGGIAFYTAGIANGSIPRTQVIENFFLSPEFGGVVAPVTRLYFATFLRTPDYPGLQYQVNAFRTGTPLTVIANNFTASPEFLATYGSLDNAQYVTLLYQNVLGRTPVQLEIDYHVNRLVSGLTRGEVMVGFSESPEYKALKFNAVYVTNMYVGMLRRAPEQAGIDGWVAYMAAGNSGQALIAGFLNAPEYHNRFLP